MSIVQGNHDLQADLVHGVHGLLDVGGDLVLGGEGLERLVGHLQHVLQHHLRHGRVQDLHGANLGVLVGGGGGGGRGRGLGGVAQHLSCFCSNFRVYDWFPKCPYPKIGKKIGTEINHVINGNFTFPATASTSP